MLEASVRPFRCFRCIMSIGVVWPVTYFTFPVLSRGFPHSDWWIQEDLSSIFPHVLSCPHRGKQLGLNSLGPCNRLCLLNLHLSSSVSEPGHPFLHSSHTVAMPQCLSCQLLPLNTVIPSCSWFFLECTWTSSQASWAQIFWDDLVYSFIWCQVLLNFLLT